MHHLYFTSLFVWCSRCVLYTSIAVSSTSLHDPCDPEQTNTARNWRRHNLTEGRHPTSKEPLNSFTFDWGIAGDTWKREVRPAASRAHHVRPQRHLEQRPAALNTSSGSDMATAANRAWDVVRAISHTLTGRQTAYADPVPKAKAKAKAKAAPKVRAKSAPNAIRPPAQPVQPISYQVRPLSARTRPGVDLSGAQIEPWRPG